MEQSLFLRANELFPGSDIVRKYSFKTVYRWDNCALLARTNRQLSHVFAVSREKSVQFYDYDCFECLSPHEIAA